MFGAKCLVLVVALSAGCAGFTSSIKPKEKHDPNSAYLYGRFSIVADGAIGLVGHNSMGFLVKCRDGKTYTIGFFVRTPLQFIKLTPAKCQVDEIVYTNASGDVVGRAMPPIRLLRNENLGRGGVYYVGDFFAKSFSKSVGTFLSPETETTWEIVSIRNNYAETTEELRRAFTNFASVPTEDRMPPKY